MITTGSSVDLGLASSGEKSVYIQSSTGPLKDVADQLLSINNLSQIGERTAMFCAQKKSKVVNTKSQHYLSSLPSKPNLFVAR